jgi:hypothetical protein
MARRVDQEKSTDDRAQEQNLADTDGMKPKTRMVPDSQRGLSQEFLAPAFAILALSEPAMKEQWRKQQQGCGVKQIEHEWHLGGILSQDGA